jgi:hypothetical protein
VKKPHQLGGYLQKEVVDLPSYAREPALPSWVIRDDGSRDLVFFSLLDRNGNKVIFQQSG